MHKINYKYKQLNIIKTKNSVFKSIYFFSEMYAINILKQLFV